MNQSLIHLGLSFAYFIIPSLVIISGELENLQGIKLNQEILKQIFYYLISSFLIINLISILVSKSLGSKINWAKNNIKYIDIPFIDNALWLCTIGLLYYSWKIGISIDTSMTRDERFSILEGSAGPLFMLFIKTGLFLCALSITKGKIKSALAFILIVAFVTFSTLSRSLLAVAVISLLPFFNINKLLIVTILIFIFSSRLIFTDNFEFNLDWLFTFGLGEMIGVTFGPYALLEKGLFIDFYDQISLMANVIPGVSLASKLGGVPEMTIFVNDFVNKNYGLYGVAGTAYLDFIASTPVFILCLALLFVIYLILYNIKSGEFSNIVIFSLYYSSCLSILLLYRWSLSGYVYSIIRDSLLFISITYTLKLLIYIGKKHDDRKQPSLLANQ